MLVETGDRIINHHNLLGSLRVTIERREEGGQRESIPIAGAQGVTEGRPGAVAGS
jgi:hypothetical protein